MELSLENFDQICRACLCVSTNMKSLFTKLESNESLLNLFNLAANLSARIEDGLPKQVCSECELVLLKLEEFKNRCVASDRLLRKLLPNSTLSNFDTLNNENDDKSNLFLDKTSDFELEEAFQYNNTKPDPTLLDRVKEEITYGTDADYENSSEYNLPLDTMPTELKEETPDLQQNLKIKNKKLPWKNKKNPPKDIDYSLITYEFSCKNCSISFADITSWQNHIATHPTDIQKEKTEDTKLFQCSLCLRRCKTKKTLSKHMKLHEQTDNIKFSCDRCKREFKYKSFLESHVISVHMHNDFTCHLCSQKFNTKEVLEAHIDSHKDKKRHVCSICSKAFIMLCTLKDHMRKHTGEKPFLCSTCGKGFSQKTNLAQHTRRHLGVKPYKCGICSKGFVSKGELDAHTRKHSGAHPFVCDDCGNGFTTSSALVKHRRTHTGERPYACDLCPMRFAASGTLKNHRRTHTGERPFQCLLCEKAFVQRTDLISHIRCHTGERPYICSQCGQAFRKAAALKTHLKMHGKESVGLVGGNVLSGMNEGLNVSAGR